MDRDADRALYRQIADDLRAGILDGDYPPGSRLPSERALAASYGVSRVTACGAVAVLKAEGLAKAEQGRGLFVASRRSLAEQLADCRQEVERLRGMLGPTRA